MRLRIPNKDEMLAILGWGGVRVIIALPQIGFYTWKQLSRLSLHVSSVTEHFYNRYIVAPFDALIWHDYNPILETKPVELLEGEIELFDFNQFREQPDRFPHIRFIGKSGVGKTTLARYVLHLLGGKQCVITAKRKPQDWQGLEVFGAQFKWSECEWALNEVLALMLSNYELIEQGLTPEMSNIACDEWRSVQKNVEGAKDIMKELLSLARDGKVRIVAIATGEQVGIWGLEGESDLGECFTDVRLGEFALEYAQKIKAPRTVQDWLKRQKIPCMVDRSPALVPDLRGYQFATAESPLKRPLEGSQTAVTVLESEFQELENGQNGVQGGTDYLLWRAIQASELPDSEVVKQVLGYTGNRYREGRELLEELKRRFG